MNIINDLDLWGCSLKFFDGFKKVIFPEAETTDSEEHMARFLLSAGCWSEQGGGAPCSLLWSEGACVLSLFFFF